MLRRLLVVAPAQLTGIVLLAGTVAASSPVDAQAPARSRWWSEVESVAEQIGDERWRKAARRLDTLRERVLRRSWRDPDLGEVFAELAFQAAVVAANRGDGDEALWEWHVALNHDRAHGGGRMAERDLTSYGAAEELFAAHPLRRRGRFPPGEAGLDPRVRGRRVEPAEPPADFETRALANDAALRESSAPVLIEILVDADGSLRQPVVLSPWSHPVVIQWGLDNLRQMPPFRPAHVDGEPVPALQEIELELSRPDRPW